MAEGEALCLAKEPTRKIKEKNLVFFVKGDVFFVKIGVVLVKLSH